MLMSLTLINADGFGGNGKLLQLATSARIKTQPSPDEVTPKFSP